MNFKQGLTYAGLTLGTNEADIDLQGLARKIQSAQAGHKPKSLPDQKRDYIFEKTDDGFDLRAPMGHVLVSVKGANLNTDQMTNFMKAVSSYTASPSAMPKMALKTSAPAPKPKQ